jgi:hypothetical protein
VIQEPWLMSEGFIPYLERTRSYYSALGYPIYEWAHHETIPFTSPDKRLADALALFESARDPGTIATSPLCWQQDDGWKRDFMNIEKLSNAQIDARREEFERQKRIASTIKQA